MTTTHYEDVLAIIGALPSPGVETERDVKWVTEAGVVGVARAYDGKIEIFLQGDPLVAASSATRELLEHQIWFRRSGLSAVQATRLLLPAAGHFDQIAAFVCTELLRNGADSDLSVAFRQTEPIIEFAIRRLRLSDQVRVGLAGELLLLSVLCQRANDNQVGAVIAGWYGWKESLRDFVLGGVGVEVKTTTRSTSTHQVQGVHQIERTDGDVGERSEEALFLVSVGVHWEEREDAFSIPYLVDSIVHRIQGLGLKDAAEVFLAHVREYGGGSDVGYDHGTMSNELRFSRKFVPRFVRAYDMTDPRVEVLRSGDIAPHQHVAPSSVTYTIDLPDRVSGDLNPTRGLHDAAALILDAML